MNTQIPKIDFTENLSDRKIMKFPYCVLEGRTKQPFHKKGKSLKNNFRKAKKPQRSSS